MSKSELLDIVNDFDEVIGSVPYEEVYLHKHPHRLVHIFLFNDKKQLLIQQRTFFKPKHGGTWMTSAGGHVRAGESYEEAAKRELQEELGIAVPLKRMGKDFLIDDGHKKFFAIFVGKTNQREFVFDPIETQRLVWKSFADIAAMMQSNEPLHPEFVAELRNHWAEELGE